MNTRTLSYLAWVRANPEVENMIWCPVCDGQGVVDDTATSEFKHCPACLGCGVGPDPLVVYHWTLHPDRQLLSRSIFV